MRWKRIAGRHWAAEAERAGRAARDIGDHDRAGRALRCTDLAGRQRRGPSVIAMRRAQSDFAEDRDIRQSHIAHQPRRIEQKPFRRGAPECEDMFWAPR